ncbi:MAG: 23S rRNA (uracil(1939)-C(5))-methyltransferase RlmD [Chloroflexota bacterium]
MNVPGNDVAEPVTVQLGAFDNHGTTRAPVEGRQIEVEHGIPGEIVEAVILGRTRARIERIVEPAADRVEPPCEYFRDWACGGCQWQHLSYEGQIQRKRESVDLAMREAGLPFTVRGVHTLDEPWRYRSTAGISLGKRAGFRRHGSLAIVPIRDCAIAHPLIGRLMAALNERLDNGAVPDFRGRLRLDVRVAELPEGPRLQVLVRSTEPGKMPEKPAVDTLLAVLTSLPEIGGMAVLELDQSIRIVREPLFAPTTVAGRMVMLSAASFFQTNLDLLGDLIARVRAEAGPLDNRRVADVYGGVGVFGLFLAESAGEVLIVESDALAVEAGRLTADTWGLTNVHFVAQDADTALTDSSAFDVVIVDPPRTGLSAGILTFLANTRPSTIIYISCLAQSLAHDLADLGASGYRLDALDLFDFYPQTYHVELLAVLRREALSTEQSRP